MQHSDPSLQHSDPSLQHSDPSLQHSDPSLQHSGGVAALEAEVWALALPARDKRRLPPHFLLPGTPTHPHQGYTTAEGAT